MCLQTSQKEPKVALKDKIVYKLFDRWDEDRGVFISPYSYFEYKIGKTYKTKIKETSDDSSFDDKAAIELKKHKKYKSFGAGFHSALKKERLIEEELCFETIVKCIIPKGAEYYIGFTGLVVSNQIIVTEEIIEA